MDNNFYTELENILEEAVFSDKDIFDIIAKRFPDRQAVDLLIALTSCYDDWQLYRELLTTYSEYLSSEEYKRLTESAKLIFEPDILEIIIP